MTVFNGLEPISYGYNARWINNDLAQGVVNGSY